MPDEDGQKAWDVNRLIELSADLPIEEVPLADIAEIDQVYWFDRDHFRPTVRSVVEHMALIEATDLAHPIILGMDGRVMDGMHRVAKALVLGRTMIGARPLPGRSGARPPELSPRPISTTQPSWLVPHESLASRVAGPCRPRLRSRCELLAGQTAKPSFGIGRTPHSNQYEVGLLRLVEEPAQRASAPPVGLERPQKKGVATESAPHRLPIARPESLTTQCPSKRPTEKAPEDQAEGVVKPNDKRLPSARSHLGRHCSCRRRPKCRPPLLPPLAI